jgi:hypothetical protein
MHNKFLEETTISVSKLNLNSERRRKPLKVYIFFSYAAN